jgi:WD40 repeat protein
MGLCRVAVAMYWVSTTLPPPTLCGGARAVVHYYHAHAAWAYTDPVTCVRFSNDGNCILVATLNNSVMLMDKQTGELLNEYVVTGQWTRCFRTYRASDWLSFSQHMRANEFAVSEDVAHGMGFQEFTAPRQPSCMMLYGAIKIVLQVPRARQQRIQG